MKSDEKVGIGFIGAGIMASDYAKMLNKWAEVDVVGVADIYEERANELAKVVDATPYTDYKEMLKNDKVEAVFVETPDWLHMEPVVAAAEAGKHIWQEKPFATTIEDAKAMYKAVKKAQKTGTKFTMQFETRWSPINTAFNYVIKWGYVGEPISADFVLNDRIDVPLRMWTPDAQKVEDWRSTKRGSSTVADFLIVYGFDLTRMMTGLEAKAVYARLVSKILKFTPDLYQALISFEKDFNAYYKSSWVQAQSKPALVGLLHNIICTEGTLHYVSPNRTFTTGAGGGEIHFPEDVSMDTLLEIQNKLRNEGITSRIIWQSEREWLYRTFWTCKEMNRALYIPTDSKVHKVKHHDGNQFKNFINCILEDREPFVTIEDAYKNAEVICAIKESADTGKIIKV